MYRDSKHWLYWFKNYVPMSYAHHKFKTLLSTKRLQSYVFPVKRFFIATLFRSFSDPAISTRD